MKEEELILTRVSDGCWGIFFFDEKPEKQTWHMDIKGLVIELLFKYPNHRFTIYPADRWYFWNDLNNQLRGKEEEND